MELVIDQGRRSVYLDGQEIPLSPQEYRVLHRLGANADEVVLKQDLLATMWAAEPNTPECLAAFNPAAVDLVVFRLRKKLESDPQHPAYLETRRGFGYILHHVQLVNGASGALGETAGPLSKHTHASTPSIIHHPLVNTSPFAPPHATHPWSTLTRREWELFLLLGDEQATCLTNRALAQQMRMTEGTLKKHLQNIYRKLGVTNRSGAALLSMRIKAQLHANPT